MRNLKWLVSCLILLMVGIGNLEAKITLPSVFGSNMVLQQKANVLFWGKATPGNTVMMSCSFSKKLFSMKAGQDGNFQFTVPTPAYGGPYFVVISDKDGSIKLENVMIGDVWICSGQSNMEMPLAGWGKILNYQQEISDANYPNIRLLQVEKQTSAVPVSDVKVGNGWAACSPASVAEFSATAYFFAREINKKTGVPIGLIHTSWGGTVAEAWMSGNALQNHPDFGAQVKQFQAMGKANDGSSEDEKVAKWQADLLKKDLGHGNGQWPWLAKKADETAWKTMVLPGLWENTVLPNFDGAVYLRKTINIPDSWAGKPLKINLGAIDDEDLTYFDGEKIGETKGYNVARSYRIPSNRVTAGVHVIAIRVFDSGGGGGVYVGQNALSITSEGKEPITLQGDWKYAIGFNLKDVGPSPALRQDPNRPTLLFNAMIYPFIKFKIKGAIWYQGESNVGRAKQYQTLFPGLITDWRKQWNIGDFPFYFVQLANYLQMKERPEESAWAELRDAQRRTLTVPNTGMAVAIDIGEEKDIHPKNKQEVGRRLALIALAKNYGIKVPYQGPMFVSSRVDGQKMRVKFTGGDDLIAKGGVLKGFALAGADHKFYWAEAEIKDGEVVLTSKSVTSPVAVRYAWADNPEGNLYNKAGLPASPFSEGKP